MLNLHEISEHFQLILPSCHSKRIGRMTNIQEDERVHFSLKQAFPKLVYFYLRDGCLLLFSFSFGIIHCPIERATNPSVNF